ncbi:alpha/beta fold hydrolase [Mesorhizobium sp. C386A]|uniref:alpha/beta fold hydrolase n=1 Tax=unclassified Mesorhizobium TaxID=325217 RepID=UPI00041A330D|nr:MULTISPECIES: alpha/beta fold hydrolase [unclassified Mesorhizobium]
MTETLYFAAGDGARIAYRLDGPQEGPVLVLSNSIATTLHMWDGQVVELASSFRVLRYGFRGHGGSDPVAGAYSLDRLGRDVLELLDFLCVARVHFLGLSLGGFVGQWLGIHAPERIERLIPVQHLAASWASMLFRRADTQRAFSQRSIGHGGYVRPKLVSRFDAGRQKRAVEPFRAAIIAMSPQGLAGCLAAVRDADLRRTISLITSPTLIIGGEDDKVTQASHSKAIAVAIPGAELLLLPGVHLLNVERPVEFTKAVTHFLNLGWR